MAEREIRTSKSNWSPVPSKHKTRVRGAAGWYGGMMSLSPASLDEECTLEGVVGRRYEGASEQAREIEGCERSGTKIEGTSLQENMLAREGVGS